MNSIVEGVIAAFLAAFVLLLICGLAFLRRFKRARKETRGGYNRVESSGGTSEKKKVLVEKPEHTVQVTWVKPWTKHEVQSKSRSYSCPARPQITTTDREERDAAVSAQGIGKAETRKQKRRRAESFSHVCQIQFSVFYNFYHSNLFLNLVCAVNIPSTFGVTYGSFIKAELVPSSSACEKSATRIKFHTNNPVFDETVVFPNISYDELLNKNLKLRLFTVDRFSRSSLVGHLLMPFLKLEINPEKPTIVWRTISSIDGRQSPKAVSKEKLDNGELYISLRYHFLSNKVTVVVMKATNLPQTNKIFGNDPYVIVKLLLNLKPVQTKKTTIKRRTSCPCWNEPLVFEIDEKIPISQYCLSFKVKSRNNLSEDLTLGQLEIGYHADGLGKEHWKDMILKKNQDRAVCHKIN